MRKIKLLFIALLTVCILCACSNKVETTNALTSGTWTGKIGNEEVTLNGAYIVDGEDVTITGEEYESAQADQTVFLVVNGGHLIIKNTKITKTGADENVQSAPTENNEKDASNENKSDNKGTPPEKPSGDSSDSSNTPPEPPEGMDGEKPELPEGMNDGDMPEPPSGYTNGTPPEKPDGDGMSQGGENDSDKYNFYGLNSAVVCIGEGSTVTMENCEITTDAEGANAVFASAGGVIEVKNTTISTEQNSSRGLFATYGGSITADTVTIETKGAHCTTIGTDRGGGTVTVNNGTLKTSGEGSPLVYSTGDITVTNSTGTAESSESVVIEGKNKVTLKKCNFTAKGETGGVMLYQSMSGDAADEDAANTDKSVFSIEDSSITYTGNGSMYYVTNTTTEVNSSNTTYKNDNELIKASAGRWGSDDKNGGILTFNSSNETLNGNVIADDISNIKLNLDNSELNGDTSGNVER